MIEHANEWELVVCSRAAIPVVDNIKSVYASGVRQREGVSDVEQ